MSGVAIRSFAKGEIAPAMYARTDQVAYATGLKTCRNLYTLRQGGVENRPGTELVGAVLGNSVARLLPFEFNDAQTYVLEFSNTALRFIRARAYVGAPYVLTTPYLASELAGLQITQSADVVTIVHPNHPPMNLSRIADTNWTLTTISFVPTTPTPSGVHLTPAESGGPFVQWCVTAVDATTGQESLASTGVGYYAVEQAITKPVTITWSAVANASAYNVYKGYSGLSSAPDAFGFIGSSPGLSFYDNQQLTPDLENRAPMGRNPFVGAGNYPAAVTYYQGRRLFGDTNNAPETVWTSRSADYNNFTTSTPSQDDDAITFTLVSKKISSIRHFVANVTLVVFTDCGEWTVTGDGADVLRPTDVNARNFSKHGASRLPPIEIGDQRVIYVQARNSVVRDIAKDPLRGFLGSDMTVMSVHLFDGHALVDWAYQEIPHSIVWIVRDDGVLLGLTDVAEQQILAWHRHDTLGSFENVCCIPEGPEDAVYVVVNRNGTRYVERFASRFFDDVQDCVFMDATLSYDGRNTTATTMTMSAGTDWTYDESITLTASASQFGVGDVGNQYFLTGSDGTVIRFSVAGYSSATVVTGFPSKTVPVSMRGVATVTWSRAVNQVSGLSHLEGRDVAIFADGFVVSSPNNPSVPTITVSGGIATLDKPYAYIHVGLPYVSDLETLPIDTPEGPSLKKSRMLISELTATVADSRGIFVGQDLPADDSLDGLVEFKVRDTETMDEPVNLSTGTLFIRIAGSSWTPDGHISMRQVDPVPLTLLGVNPTGYIPPA